MNRLTIEANMDNFEEMVSFVGDECRNAGLEPKITNKIHLAFEEAAVNIINYAYGDESGTITIECDYIKEKKMFRIVLIDEGQAFNPLASENPNINAPVQDRPIGGLGIFMIRQIVDEIFYERIDNKNVFTMIKYS